MIDREKVNMKNKVNQHIIEFCDNEFTRWYNSRGRYLNSRVNNILAQFMPSKSGVDRDYPNSVFCNAFNLAMQLEIDKNPIKAVCFLYVYFKRYKPKTLKAYLHEDLKDEVTLITAIRWAHETAERIHHLSVVNTNMYHLLNAETNNFMIINN